MWSAPEGRCPGEGAEQLQTMSLPAEASPWLEAGPEDSLRLEGPSQLVMRAGPRVTQTWV